MTESEELSFYLQSGLVLCQLAAKVVPDTAIDINNIQVGRQTGLEGWTLYILFVTVSLNH